MNTYKVLIIGGGPCGIACAAELKKHGISDTIIVEKGSVTESIRRYPRRMRFFSTAENIEIAGIPFPTSNVKATRDEALQYYRKVAAYYGLKFKLNTRVTHVSKEEGRFCVDTEGGGRLYAEFVVIATGYFDKYCTLDVEGENLPHVSHYYIEPYSYSFQKVVIVGAGNSAVEAALDLYRHDADVTILHRGSEIKPTAKYWLVPDLQNRIKEGKIRIIYNARVKEIKAKTVVAEDVNSGQKIELEADQVLLLIGHFPDRDLLQACGLKPHPKNLTLDYNEATFESEISGLYLCGTVLAGIHTESVFIENGREHAKVIASEIAKHTATSAQPEKTISQHG